MKESHSTSEYSKCNNTIEKAMQEAKEFRMKCKYSEIENNLMRHNINKLIVCCLQYTGEFIVIIIIINEAYTPRI